MENKPTLPGYVQDNINLIDKQIAAHTQIIAQLQGLRKMWADSPAPELQIVQENQTLTRRFVRSFIKRFAHPIQTTQLIELIFPRANEEDKYNLTKHLSVMLHQMTKNGELLSRTETGVKGNFYSINPDYNGTKI